MNPYFPIMAIATAVIMGGAGLMYHIESGDPDAQIKTPLDAFWWTAATVTTVGYGDVVPVTELGRTVAIFYMFFGIAIAGVFLSIIGTKYYKKRLEGKEAREDYYPKKLLEKIENLEKQHQEDFKNLENHMKKLEEKCDENNK